MSYYCNGKCELKVEILPLKSMDDCSKKNPWMINSMLLYWLYNIGSIIVFSLSQKKIKIITRLLNNYTIQC
jgi:hypothetical protein